MDTTRPVRLKLTHVPTVVIITPENATIINAMVRSVMALGNCPMCKAPTYIPCLTSGLDGIHSAGSRHYANAALDFRSSDWPLGSRDTVLRALAGELGNDFTYRIESDHLHIERRA